MWRSLFIQRRIGGAFDILSISLRIDRGIEAGTERGSTMEKEGRPPSSFFGDCPPFVLRLKKRKNRGAPFPRR